MSKIIEIWLQKFNILYYLKLQRCSNVVNLQQTVKKKSPNFVNGMKCDPSQLSFWLTFPFIDEIISPSASALPFKELVCSQVGFTSINCHMCSSSVLEQETKFPPAQSGGINHYELRRNSFSAPVILL